MGDFFGKIVAFFIGLFTHKARDDARQAAQDHVELAAKTQQLEDVKDAKQIDERVAALPHGAASDWLHHRKDAGVDPE